MNSMRLRLVMIFCCFFLGTVRPVEATDYSYTLGIGGARGSYDLGYLVTTQVLVNSVEVQGRLWAFEASIPVFRQDSSDVSWIGGMPMPRRGLDDPGGSGGGGGMGGGMGGDHGGGGHHPPATTDTGYKTGVGDPILRFSHEIIRSFSGASALQGVLSIKAPLSNEIDGFGTGEWDYGAGVRWFFSGSRSALTAELIYWSLGDSAEVEYEDGLAFRVVGAMTLPDERFTTEIFFGGQTESIDGYGTPVHIGMTLSRTLPRLDSLFVSIAAGVSDAAPDYSLLTGVRFAF